MTSSNPVENSQSFPNVPLNDQEAVSKPPPRLEPSPLPADLLKSAPSVPDCILDPPSTVHYEPSPLKSQRRSSSSLSGQGKLAFMQIITPSPQLFATDSPAKKAPAGKHHRRAPSLPQPASFITFANINPKQSRKENDVACGANNGNFIEFSEPTYGRKAPLKRRLTDAASTKDNSIKKQKQDEPLITVPAPHEMPPIEDDGMKPPFSYATLIGMSILRAPNRRLTLAQIYKWISSTYSFYRNSDSCWQNSIRHNLSLNKAFVKQERPKDDPGKGNYWAIEPGMEVQFLKDKLARRATLSTIPLPPSDLQRESFCQGPGTSMWRIAPPRPTALPVSQPPVNQDLSSDATLPASDPAFQEDASDEGLAVAVPASQPQIPCSSPPQFIHSSPPIAPSRFIRQRTPPTPSRPTTSAAAPRHRKRKSVVANDSGYFSSLESSVMKPTMAHLLTSDPDAEPPQIKRGRAEEEIARIRSSSHDLSPSHSNMLKDPIILSGSSPFRGDRVSMLPPPLTPVIKFKKPARPPASLSPNTNLRNHRRRIQHMVNSPLKTLGLTDEDLPWSPAFNILHDETLTPNENSNSHFDIFADPLGENISTPVYGSPEKRRTKRVVLGDTLTDITAISGNRRIDTPVASKKFKLGLPESPSKILDPGRYIDATNDDCFSFSVFDESPHEVDGIDLLQGFQKINGASMDESISKGHGFQPHLGHRNNTFL